MSIMKGKLRRSAVVVAFSLGAFQALSIVGANVASAVGACSFSGGVLTVAAPAAGDNLLIYVDTNGGIHAATSTGAAAPAFGTDIATCNGATASTATVTTINVTGDSGPTNNDQTVFIEMSTRVPVTGAATATIANWGTINWTVNLGSNSAVGDTLVVQDTANTTKPLDLTAGANGIDLNSDGDLDVTVANVENFWFDSFSDNENTVDLNGSTITGGPFVTGSTIGNTPQTLNTAFPSGSAYPGTSLMATDSGDNILRGGAGNDSIFGGLAADTISPGLGSDAVNCTLNGGPIDLGGFFGDNQCTLDYSNTTTAINANLPINTVTQGTDLDSVGPGAKDVVGTAGADTLTGRDGENNWLQPGAGDDHVTGGTNAAVVAAAQTGGDTVDYSDATTGITVDLVAGTETGGSGTDTLAGMENVVGGAGADSISGSTGANLLWGGDANDTLAGGPGDGDGADYFNGGSGTDTVDYGANTLSTTVDLEAVAPATQTLGNGIAAEGDVIASDTIENAILGSGDDTFTGSVFNNIVFPNGGQNALLGGGGGIDTVNYSVGYTAGVVVNLSGGGQAGGNQDSITGFTNAVGTEFNDTLIGTDTVGGTNGANLLVGGKGNDNISANAGPDLVRAGAGNDRIRGGSGDDTLMAQGGKDNVRGGQGDDDIFGGKGTDFCVGGAGHDLIKTCERPRHHHQGPNGPGVAVLARLATIKP